MAELIVVISFVLAVFGLCAVAADYSCGKRWEGSGVESNWKPWQGCRVHVRGRWIPEKMYRVTESGSTA